MAAGRPSLEEVFAPRGVAVVGASATGRTFATGVLMSLQTAGFPAIYPINPKHSEVLGLPCYASVSEVPGPVDHVVVSIPAEAALSLLDDCAAKEVRSVHFFTAGFSESGEAARADLEMAMLDKARRGGFRILGPNCIGLFVPRTKLVNGGGPLEPGPVAFISQSGGHATILPAYGAPRGLRFSKVVSYGNGLDIDDAELLDYLADDDETEIIAAYIEGAKDGDRFRRALAKAAARKPVVIYKGGTTGAGQRAAHGHTASLTSSVAVFNALCRQTGAILVDDIDEMVDVLVALHFAQPLPQGKGIVIIGAGGGPSVLASDEMEKADLHLPNLSSVERDRLKEVLPVAGSIFANPIDTPNMGTPPAIEAAVGIVSRLPEVDILLYHLGFHPISSWAGGRFSAPEFLDAVTGTFRRAREATGKPVLLALRPGVNLGDMKEFLAAQEAFVAAGFPVFHSMRQAGLAMARVIAWAAQRQD